MDERQTHIDRLRALFAETAKTKKHSAYQTLPDRVAALVDPLPITLYRKYEAERLRYITTHVSLNDRSVLDIGCNTGYFTFEALRLGARRVSAYEGSCAHREFVTLAARLLGEEARLTVKSTYFEFGPNEEHHDVGFLLNVLHHCGDEFDKSATDMEAAKSRMLAQLQAMHSVVDVLVLQMGFNWKGDIRKCLFTHGTKREMIDFVFEGARDYWHVRAIGIAEGPRAQATYRDLNARNIARDDALGEFLNRPIFVLERKG